MGRQPPTEPQPSAASSEFSAMHSSRREFWALEPCRLGLASGPLFYVLGEYLDFCEPWCSPTVNCYISSTWVTSCEQLGSKHILHRVPCSLHATHHNLLTGCSLGAYTSTQSPHLRTSRVSALASACESLHPDSCTLSGW